MEEWTFETLTFEDRKECIRLTLLRLFFCDIPKTEFPEVKVDHHSICYSGKQAKLLAIFERYFSQLKNSVSGNPVVYIHQHSGIPLFGQTSYGIVFRNSSLIEIKPLTSCNLSCIFCSVDEGKGTRKVVDYVVECDYLLSEFSRFIKTLPLSHIQVYINTQGEPLLYADMVGLVKGLHAMPKVNSIAINTNGILLSTKLIDSLCAAGLSQLNLSLNALDHTIATQLAGAGYPVKHVMDMAKYAGGKVKVIIAPVWLPGINDDEMPKIIAFANSIHATVGIQNFLPYKRGRNPVQSKGMDEFYRQLQSLEKQTATSLLRTSEEFKIVNIHSQKPKFRKNQILEVECIAPGRYPHETLARAQNYAVSVKGSFKKGEKKKVKVVRVKHNIFSAIPL